VAFEIPLLIIALVAGLYMAWAIGANDVANAMGTSVGSGSLTMKRAIIVAAVFEFSGALLAGASVSKTIRKGIVDPAGFESAPELLVYGMIGSLLAAAVWLNIASKLGWPVSTTHSVVGAIVGFACVALGVGAVNWAKVGAIVASWVTSPLLSGTVAFVLFFGLQRLIFRSGDPFASTKRWAPVMVFGTTFIIALVTLFKGLKHLHLDFGLGASIGIAAGVGVVGAAIGQVVIRKLQPDSVDPQKGRGLSPVERVFAILEVYTACAVAFAHGSNDVANAIGPMAAVVATIRSGAVATSAAVPIWMLLLGGIGIVVGLATYGYKVMLTIGTKITELKPSRGYVAEFAAAVTIVLASQMGLPISTTHTLIGAVLGVSLARGIAATNFAMVGQIILSWVITIPAGAGLSIVFYFILKGLFGG
jgi:inorganic phosphate transporter, PiT family